MYTKVIIEDLANGYNTATKDLNNILVGRADVVRQQRLAIRVPRDESVWVKNISQRNLLKRCKENYKKEMLKLYPHFTNKKMIVNLKVVV